MSKYITLSAALLGVIGCATVQIPDGELQKSESTIRSAEELGASGVPAARLHLQLAKNQTLEAKQMELNGDSRAEMVLARAQSDAELALGLAREASVHTAAMAAAEDLKAVQARGTP